MKESVEQENIQNEKENISSQSKSLDGEENISNEDLAYYNQSHQLIKTESNHGHVGTLVFL